MKSFIIALETFQCPSTTEWIHKMKAYCYNESYVATQWSKIQIPFLSFQSPGPAHLTNIASLSPSPSLSLLWPLTFLFFKCVTYSPFEPLTEGSLFQEWRSIKRQLAWKVDAITDYVKLIWLLGLPFIYYLVFLNAVLNLQLLIWFFLIPCMFLALFSILFMFFFEVGLAAVDWLVNTYLVIWEWLDPLETPYSLELGVVFLVFNIDCSLMQIPDSFYHLWLKL